MLLDQHEAIYLRELVEEDAEALFTLRRNNRDFLQPFEPIRPGSFWTLEGQIKDVWNGITGAELDQACVLGIFLKESDRLIGRVALTAFARGVFQNANIGYFMAQDQNGKGYMTAAVRMSVDHAFRSLGLHRVQAGVMPRNLRSLRVLEKAGFRREGLAERYLQINGVWEDHVLLAVTAEEWPDLERVAE